MRSLPGMRKGRAWGNALGGFRKQRRNAMGRWVAGPGSPTRAPSARKMKKFQKSQQNQPKASYKTAEDVIAFTESINRRNRSRSPLRKDKSTSLLRAQNRSQQQFKRGMSRQGGFVPYTRHGFSSNSVGFNAGMRVLPNYRLSGGVYLKVTNIDKTRREKQIRNADNEFMNKVSQGVSPHPIADPYIESGLRRFRRKSIDKLFGGERKVTKNTYARLSTDMNAMPTVTIEYNRKDPRTRKKKRSEKARRRAQWQYNDMVTKNRGVHVKPPRPQRRG